MVTLAFETWQYPADGSHAILVETPRGSVESPVKGVSTSVDLPWYSHGEQIDCRLTVRNGVGLRATTVQAWSSEVHS